MRVFPIIFLGLLTTCQSSNEGKGQGEFQTTANGLQYHIVEQTPGARKGNIGDRLMLDFRYVDENEKVIYDSKSNPNPAMMGLIAPAYKGDPMEGLAMMSEGDSMIFKVPVDSFYLISLRGTPIPDSLRKGSMLTFHIRLNKVHTQEELQEEFRNSDAQAREQEDAKLKSYLEENNITVEPTSSGLYYIETKKGTGSNPTIGKNVRVHYTGKFLNGQVFDSSVERDKPLLFPIGMGQVIRGWDEGIAMIKVGGKATLVIPSHIAYGPQGKGQIGPYTTLVFDVELIEADL